MCIENLEFGIWNLSREGQLYVGRITPLGGVLKSNTPVHGGVQ